MEYSKMVNTNNTLTIASYQILKHRVSVFGASFKYIMSFNLRQKKASIHRVGDLKGAQCGVEEWEESSVRSREMSSRWSHARPWNWKPGRVYWNWKFFSTQHYVDSKQREQRKNDEHYWVSFKDTRVVPVAVGCRVLGSGWQWNVIRRWHTLAVEKEF